jgi:HEAT repeat protein
MAAPSSKPTTVRTQDPANQDGLLSMFAPPSPQTAAQWATDRHNPDLRYRGTLLLATASWGGEPLYLSLYEAHAADPEPNVRVAAMRALGNHGGPEHAPILVQALSDDEPRVRVEAARALQRIYAPDAAIDPLIAATRETGEDEAEVRAQAAIALGQYATGAVVQELIAALSDTSLAVNHAALTSLRILTGQDFGYDRRAWTAWVNQAGAGVFAARGTYLYPVFNRPRKILEYLPFIPQPPNEHTALPAGTPIGQ